MTIRELDSYEELHEMVHALKDGAVLVDKPRYPGQFYRFSDGTTLAYRTYSSSGGDNDPTVDVAVPGKKSASFKVPTEALKVHAKNRTTQ